MKRILILCLTISLICSIFCCSINAEETENPHDARYIPDEIAEQLSDYENADLVFKQYYGRPSYSGGIGSIDRYMQALTAEATPYTYYVMVAESVARWYEIEDGVAVEQGSGEIAYIVKEMLTHEAIYTVAPDICIEGIYCLVAPVYVFNDMTILYKTNLGDYVYFATEQTQPVLMTVRRYDEYIAAWAEYRVEMEETKGQLMGGRYVLHIDFSAYDWTSPTFDPDAPLPIEKDEPEQEFPWLIVGIGTAVLLAAAAVTTVLLIRRKKKKTEPEEMEPTPEET